ncbi:MAG: hypothetical protein A2161_02805 [Candidatus Schekmanbacteria bacterium RBG_13_48_7]|uniref:Glycosyltransferase 2-like domain-containing protein n=1 Tax=Candidatus Schekmanbacteria bacterium RBG_13_48_7 TaxID=1817878 RepID=A0A1F7RTZ5_9BACT|nr:MAG: hypothetical protein A2161_02805 [Candidatus Schekmanbacteria bacterium RBG_13_48_7]
MFKNFSVSLVIPCLNEEEGLIKLFPAVPEVIDQILLVDNGSTDNSAGIAEKAGATVIHEKQKGYGKAYKTGFAHVKTDIVTTLDADNSYPVSEIPRLLDILISKNLDFLNASRFPLADISAMKFANKFGNHVFTIMGKLMFGMNYNDVLSGMWVFRSKIIPKLDLQSDGWAFSEEIKIEAHINPAIKVGEERIHFCHREGEVKLPTWRGAYEGITYFFIKKNQIRKRNLQ